MINFDNTYAKLPEKFYERINPSAASKAELLKFNYELADVLGINTDNKDALAKVFSGTEILDGSEPIAQAYAGHQFGHFVPQLGDGRAVLLGEVIDKEGHRKDIQLKGSGRTRFSRGGDGKAALGPVLREYIVSEAMHALGVPTTRSLAATTSGDTVVREQLLTGAVLTRIASSHIRVGTFEYFAGHNDTESLELLVDYVIDRHYPHIVKDANKYNQLILAVSERQAELINLWMSYGFIHGVMNTDNTSICGETIDYGPCAFMDFYDPHTVFSSIDQYGRYAYSNQPNICKWNIMCLAQALVPLASDKVDEFNESIALFGPKFEAKFLERMRHKIGLESEAADELVKDLLDLMHKYKADFTLSFAKLKNIVLAKNEEEFFHLFDQISESKKELESWISRWQEHEINLELMESVNPVIIPRNHNVEAALEAAYRNDFKLFEDLNLALKNPFQEQAEFKYLEMPPLDKDGNYQTFCGT